MMRIFTIFIIFVLIFSGTAWASDMLIVFAGAGMRKPLDEIGKQFETINGVRVVYDYEGSGRLGNKILAGQTPDLFIPGSEKWANLLKQKEIVKTYFPIAYHIPVIITPVGNTKVGGLKDFGKQGVRLALGDAKAAAIGKATHRILENAGIDHAKLNVVARGVTVKQVLRWIEMSTADAGMVWHADAVQSGKVLEIPIPESVNIRDVVPVCEMYQPPHPKLARKFISYLASEGKSIFGKHGFKTPE